jgi:hypothetical protein
LRSHSSKNKRKWILDLFYASEQNEQQRFKIQK